MLVEQKFAAHLVPKRHKVRQATSEFKDFALIWWTSLSQKPDTWENLKLSMHDRFVPISYKRDLRKKLQRLEKGDMLVQDYFVELQKGKMRCGVVEDPEDKLCCFYGGLRREIQDIVDYKDFNTTNQLFQIAMLVEKELQGRQQQPPRSRSNYGSSYAPKAIMPPPAKSSGALPLAPSASTRSPSPASIQTTPPATTPSNIGKTRLQVPAKSSSSVASTGRSSTI
jgi:hypothetical protein